jgi:hypothetical protein
MKTPGQAAEAAQVARLELAASLGSAQVAAGSLFRQLAQAQAQLTQVSIGGCGE